jgi:hypothetical protein
VVRILCLRHDLNQSILPVEQVDVPLLEADIMASKTVSRVVRVPVISKR